MTTRARAVLRLRVLCPKDTRLNYCVGKMEEVRFLSPVTAKGVKMILEYFTNNWMEKMSEAYTVKNEMYMT